MRGWRQGQCGRPAWCGRVSATRAGNKDEITFLLRDLEERGDNCPQKAGPVLGQGRISGHDCAEPQVHRLRAQWPQPHAVSNPSPAVLRGAVEKSKDRMWFFPKQLP